MGMYTEIYVNVDFKRETPNSVLDVLKAIVNNNLQSEVLNKHPHRWKFLFSDGSYYTPLTSCKKLTYDCVAEHWSFLGKGDIKNYNAEIQMFFDFIAPFCEDGFIGYFRYEEELAPTLVFVNEEGKLLFVDDVFDDDRE